MLFPDVQSLDVTGPLEVFAGAAAAGEARVRRAERGYEIHTLSADGAPLRTSSGLTLVPDGRLEQAPAKIDTLIVPGGRGARPPAPTSSCWHGSPTPRAGRGERRRCARARSCSAAAGLLDGRRATTHWASAAALARLYPGVRVDPDPIYVRDGNVWTSAG